MSVHSWELRTGIPLLHGNHGLCVLADIQTLRRLQTAQKFLIREYVRRAHHDSHASLGVVELLRNDALKLQ